MIDQTPNPVSFAGSTPTGGAFSLIWVKPMTYGKVDPLVYDRIEKSIAEAVLPLQQTIARLEAAIEALKRERVVPGSSAEQPKQKSGKGT